MQISKKLKKSHVIIALLLCLQVLTMLIFGARKENYFMDEIWSYGLANGHYATILHWQPDFLGTWHEPDYYMDYITTNAETRFRYDSVVYNQSQEVHPPLYYMLLHTICSFFPNMLSKWFGIGLNLVFFLLTSLLLFRVSKSLLTNQFLVFLPNILWGFSIGAVSAVIFIRMYMMLTFAVLLFFDAHVRLIHQQKLGLRPLLLCFASTLLGALTQHYFLFFAFFLTAFTCLAFFLQKRIKHLLLYGASVGMGVLALFIIFPAAYTQLFVGYRGAEAIDNMLNLSRLGEQLAGYLDTIAWELLGHSKSKYLFFLGILLCALYFLQRFVLRFSLKQEPSGEQILITGVWWPKFTVSFPVRGARLSVCALSFATVCYLIMVSQASPYVTGRYIYCSYPLIILLLSCLVDWIVPKVHASRKAKGICVYAAACAIVLAGFTLQTPEYLYEGGAAPIQTAKDNRDAACIYISTSGGDAMSNYLELAQYRASLVVLATEMDAPLQAAAQDIPTDAPLILYIPEELDVEETLHAALQTLKRQDAQELYRYNGKIAYRAF